MNHNKYDLENIANEFKFEIKTISDEREILINLFEKTKTKKILFLTKKELSLLLWCDIEDDLDNHVKQRIKGRNVLNEKQVITLGQFLSRYIDLRIEQTKDRPSLFISFFKNIYTSFFPNNENTLSISKRE